LIDISTWLKTFLSILVETFDNRIYFVGLQGSYARGEATEASDIDIVVILDELSAIDIQRYNAMLDKMPHRELICGFLSGKRELLNWETSDLFQFYHDTKPIKGALDCLIPLLDSAAVERAIKMGACNIYHSCVHNMLHEKTDEILRGLYKSASFVVQALVFNQTGLYVRHLKELLNLASSDDRAIIETFLRFKNGEVINFDKDSERLFCWVQRLI
jgi:hypothetical protein